MRIVHVNLMNYSAFPALVILFLAEISSASAWYVDKTATGANNGSSWTDAWTDLGSVTGVSPSDTVYISGGTTSQIYSASGWTPKPAKYQTGQDTAHNGMVILDGGGGEYLITPKSKTTLSGFVTGSSLPHMQFQNAWDAHVFVNSGSVDKLHISYVNDPKHNRFLFCANNANVTDIEIDHCTLHKVYGGRAGALDDTFYLGGSSGGRFHDNLIESPVCSTLTPYGADVWKWGDGYSVYNNHVRIYLDPSYPGVPGQQHADIFQTSGSNIAIYNNWFENIGESVFFHNNNGSSSGNFTNILFYNNVITQSFPASTSQVARGLDFEPQDSQKQDTFTNVLVANNLFQVPTLFTMRFHQAVRWTHCRVCNNIYYECNDPSQSSWDSTAQRQIAVDHNSIASASWFVNAAAGDFHPAMRSPAMAAGVALAHFNSDKDGVFRPASWSRGPYETVSNRVPRDPRIRASRQSTGGSRGGLPRAPARTLRKPAHETPQGGHRPNLPWLYAFQFDFWIPLTANPLPPPG
jgi:hypothetical protein